ncbi:hypothetical protein KR222_010269, partial [Zaprionus bogoriensis]
EKEPEQPQEKEQKQEEQLREPEPEPEQEEPKKAKKCVTFNPNDEKIRKFTTGEPIVDQQNPFKSLGGRATGAGEKRTPPPVPTKRSTLSVRKTVTQQLREREREKEREREEKLREQQKNEANTQRSRKSAAIAAAASKLSPDEYVTTEEVLKQSKYVKTYIKNPDPYFVYDPTVLARLKFEELRDIAGKLPKRKQARQPQEANNKLKQSHNQQLQQQQQQQQNLSNPHNKSKPLAFKKCSKPNYPELAQLKIRTGTADANGGDYFNPAEVTKNAKKFDERVKKLQISSDDDLDEIDGPLTKSESSDELTRSTEPAPTTATPSPASTMLCSSAEANEQQQQQQQQPPLGTFTNTISSEEFQAYLQRKGLALMPRRELNSPTLTPTPTATPTRQSAEERRQQVAESLAALRKSSSSSKKLSVLQRLSNSLFAVRRKTTPKGAAPLPRSSYGLDTDEVDENRKYTTPAELRRIRLERPPEQQLQQLPLPNGVSAALKPTPLQRQSLERQSLIPRRVSPEGQASRFQRSSSMDRSQIKQRQQPAASRLESVGQRRSLAAASLSGEAERQHYPMATSTPLRRVLQEQQRRGQQLEQRAEQQAEQQARQQQGQAQQSPSANPGQHQHEWEQLRAIKEVTDRQLYHKVLQQQQQALPSVENIYEHLQTSQQQLQSLATPTPTPYFVRGSLQRNTFSGVSGRNRQVMILDGAPITAQAQAQSQPAAQQQAQAQPQPQLHPQPLSQAPPPRCQSVLDELITPSSRSARSRGYESENEATPVIMRRKESKESARRIGGLLTREEILDKVKEFCRKSIQRQPAPAQQSATPAATKMQPIYERQQQLNMQHNADISPVSYASVEQQHKRPLSQLRVQSLPRSSFAPIGASLASAASVASPSPIYAHVQKRSSILSNDSEAYASELALPASEYVLIQTEDGGLQAARLIDYHNSVYMQPQQLLQRASGPQGYQLQQGRATPLILDRAAQQSSQIYWTPQHQRLQQQQQQQGSLSLPKSPRRAAAGQLHSNSNGSNNNNIGSSRLQLTRNSSDWDCSSEAGEVRRIMEQSL